MNLIFDNIVFALQRAGGISVYWYELLSRFLLDSDINCKVLDYSTDNIFRDKLAISDNKIIKAQFNLPIKLERYINPKECFTNSLFHSSYYRYNRCINTTNITTVHDFTYEIYKNGFAKFVHTFQKSQSILKSGKIICVSNNTKNDLIKFFPSLNHDNIKVVHNGVDDTYKILQDRGSSLIKNYINYSTGEYVLYVGDRKSKYKNFITAVKSCQIQKKPLVIIGGQKLDKFEVDLLISSLGKNNYTQLIGIDNETLNIIYNNACCLLYPSLYEGFGIPILEAQRAGCPVISSNLSSIPEVAGKGAILLNDINEKNIAEMIFIVDNDSQLKENLINEGIRNSANFSWDRCYIETKNIYKEILDKNL